MSKKLHTLVVKGKNHTWAFDVYASPEYVAEWRADGLTVEEISNVVPNWIVEIGLTRVWCFVQDLFHFKNPFGRYKDPFE
jgi:hypothetical protein